MSDHPVGFDDGITAFYEVAACLNHDDSVSTWLELRPDLLDESGALLVGALSYGIDAAVGMAAGFAALPNWVVTADIDLHLARPVHRGPLRVDARVIRAGSRQILVECQLFDGGDLVGFGSANHTVLPPDRGAPMERLEPGRVYRNAQPPRPDRPHVLDHYGVKVVEPGLCELELVARTKNPWGIMHGSLYGLAAEQAVRSTKDAQISDLILRFGAPARVGPVQAAVDGEAGGVVQVHVIDKGADDRICAVVHARIRE